MTGHGDKQVDLRIAIVEDDPHYRGSLETLLGLEPGFRLVASYPAATLLIAALDKLSPADPLAWDIVLMDIDLPGMSGIEATHAIKSARADATVVMLTAFEDSEKILAAICAGADGYLLKRAGVAEVIDQLGSVAIGGSPMTPGIARSVLGLVRGAAGRSATLAAVARSRPSALELSEREQDVLQQLVRGLSYKQVAGELSLSIDTVRTYIRRIYRKLQVHNVSEAVARAIREGLA